MWNQVQNIPQLHPQSRHDIHRMQAPKFTLCMFDPHLLMPASQPGRQERPGSEPGYKSGLVCNRIHKYIHPVLVCVFVWVCVCDVYAWICVGKSDACLCDVYVWECVWRLEWSFHLHQDWWHTHVHIQACILFICVYLNGRLACTISAHILHTHIRTQIDILFMCNFERSFRLHHISPYYTHKDIYTHTHVDIPFMCIFEWSFCLHHISPHIVHTHTYTCRHTIYMCIFERSFRLHHVSPYYTHKDIHTHM